MKVCIYATIDLINGAIGKPFLARNDEKALIEWKEAEKELIKEKIDTSNISVINLGYYKLELMKNTTNDRNEYYPAITDTLTPYDIMRVHPNTKIRDTIKDEEEKEREEFLKEQEKQLKKEKKEK